jgi:hypothetical protein
MTSFLKMIGGCFLTAFATAAGVYLGWSIAEFIWFIWRF